MKALDASFSAADIQWFDARKAEGYELFIADAWTGVSTPAACIPNLTNARAAGLRIAVYTVVSSARSGQFAADVALGVTPWWSEYAFVAVDVEGIEGLPDPTEAQVRDCIARIEELGQRPILYSRPGFIAQYPDFGVPRWMAIYDGYPVLEPGDIGKQHSGSTLIEGVEVDLSVFDDAFVLEDDMGVTQDDITAIKQELWKQAQTLAEMAGTDDAIKQLLWQINDRVKALEATGHDALPTEQKLTDLDARIKKAGQALSG